MIYLDCLKCDNSVSIDSEKTAEQELYCLEKDCVVEECNFCENYNA